MAIYRTISMSFWTDSKVVDDFTPEDRYFYLYLFTNPHTNLCGCYEVSVKQIAYEIGYSVDCINMLLKRFAEAHNVIRYNEQNKEVLLLNWHKYNWTVSEKFRKPLLKEISNVKTEHFKEYLEKCACCGEDGYGIDTTCIDITDTVSVTDTVINTVNNKHRFTPPTLPEVQQYITENGYHVNADSFVDFYSSCGWVIGKNKPMKDWKAAVRNWNRRDTVQKPKIKTAPSETHNYDMEALRRRAKE